MPSYYVSSQPSSTRRGRSAVRNSYTSQPMSSPGYQQAQFYYPNSPVAAAAAYSDNGHGYAHRPRHNSLGPGGVPAYAQPSAGTYYVARSPSRHAKRSSSHRPSTHGHGHSHHSSHGHGRSHSQHNHGHSHHRSSSRPRRSHSATPQRRYTIDTTRTPRFYTGSSRYPTSHLSLGDRIRKFFGIGPWGHHAGSRTKTRFVDARTGKQVRPVVRY